MAERLIWNHYAMNRTPNGGYGVRRFVCDDKGPLLMKSQYTEAVWCCTFHGLLGLHTLKSYIIAGSSKGVFINFPVSATALVQTSHGRWQVSINATEPVSGEIQCHVRLDPLENKLQVPGVFVRRPSWATKVTLTDAGGRPLPWNDEQGYLLLSLQPGAAGEATLTFSGPPRVEDRRMLPVTLNPKGVTRQAGVTLWVGPHLLLANSDKLLPVLVARVGQDGHLLLPTANTFLQVDRLDVTEEQIKQTATHTSMVKLTPWETIHRDTTIGFVFNLITLPANSPVLRP